MLNPIAPSSPRNKQPFIIDAITRLARKLGPGMKLPTAHELSRQLGVTIATLDRSLTTLESRGVINRRQGSGIYVSDCPIQKTIALVFGVNVFEGGISPIYSVLLKQCEKRASSLPERFSVFLGSPALSGGSQSPLHYDLDEALNNGKLDGVLLFAKASARQEDVLRERGIPMAALTAHSEWPGVVSHDAQGMIRSAILALRDEGCKTIGLLGALSEHAEAFRKEMRRTRMSVSEQWIFFPDENDQALSVHQGLYEREKYGHRWASQIVSGKDLPDGLISTDDMITRGACPVFLGNELRIGKDFFFATHANNDSFVLEEWGSGLIRFVFDSQETVDAMFAALDAHMNGTPLQEPVLIAARRC